VTYSQRDRRPTHATSRAAIRPAYFAANVSQRERVRPAASAQQAKRSSTSHLRPRATMSGETSA